MAGIIATIRKLGTEIPDEYRAEFNREVLYRNIVRVRVICWTLLVGIIPYGVADYYTLEALGTPESSLMAKMLASARACIILFTIFFLFRIGYPAGPADLKKRHRYADLILIITYMVYMGVTLGFMYSFRTELSIYLLFILVGSAFLIWTTRQSLMVLVSAFVSLAFSLPFFGADWNQYKYGLITLGIMTFICFVLAQLQRINRIQGFLNRKTIEQQNEELQLERVEAERARKVAVKASQAKSDFLAAMSHEIRTPMNAIIGMTEVTLETSLEEQQRRYLTTAYDSAQQLMAIINDILDFSKIEAGKLSLERLDFDLSGTLESVIEAFGPMADARQLDLGLEVEGALPARCVGDQLRLRQVLMNLLSNAIKFTDAGSVTLSVWADDPRPGSKEQAVRFSVIDTGIGVPPKKREMIFDRFSQADSSISRLHGGTGLGLAISRRLAELMNGSLEYEPNFGQGSVFTLTIPLEPSEDLKTPEVTEVRPEEGGSLHILVADDSEVNLQVTRTQLQMLGHSSETVCSGAEAVTRLATHSFDLVLMDVEMPDMDGMTATRIIREGGPDKDWPESLRMIPVFALTGHAVEDVRAEAGEAGMTKFLTKPMRMADLKQALSSLAAGGSHVMEDEVDGTTLFDPHGAMSFLGLESDAYGTALLAALRQLEKTEISIAAARDEGDLTEIGHHVHAFKGAAHIMGSTRAVEALERVEYAVAEGDSELALSAAQALLDVLQALSVEAKKQFGEVGVN